MFILSLMLLVNIAPVFAAQDGQGLYMATTSTPMKASASSSSSTIMTLSANEAIPFINTSSNGYNYYMGYQQGYGIVRGYVLASQSAAPTNAYVITPVNVYSSETGGTILGEISYNCSLNSNHIYKTYQNMNMLYVTNYSDFTGYWHTFPGYVHTNFDTGNVWAYYIGLM